MGYVSSRTNSSQTKPKSDSHGISKKRKSTEALDNKTPVRSQAWGSLRRGREIWHNLMKMAQMDFTKSKEVGGGLMLSVDSHWPVVICQILTVSSIDRYGVGFHLATRQLSGPYHHGLRCCNQNTMMSLYITLRWYFSESLQGYKDCRSWIYIPSHSRR